MLTAAHARFITYANGISRRFVDFAVDAFDSCRDASSPDNCASSTLWSRHFAGTGFDDRKEEFHEVAAEILFSRTVDDFQYYLADITEWALWRRPSVAGLQDKAKLRAAELSEDLDDAVKEVARLHAEKISYGGFVAIVSFIESTFAVTLLVDLATKTKLRRIIAVRNMIVHNHARKNARYCKDLGEPTTNVGQPVRPSLADARSAAEDLAAFVELVDSTLIRELP